MSGALPLAAALAAANAMTLYPRPSLGFPLIGYGPNMAKHKPEQVPDWVQSDKIRKAQEKRDRKAKAREAAE